MTHTTPGQRFRTARERLGLSQVRVAALVGTVQTDVSAFETGRKPISLERLHAWCTACGIDPAAVDSRLAATAGRL